MVRLFHEYFLFKVPGFLVVMPIDVKLCHIIVSVWPWLLSTMDDEWLHLAHT